MKKLENQKEIIFNTALEILTSENVEKFSIRMISTRCNIGMGTIYKYYGNKDDILLDIIKNLWMSYITEIRTTTETFIDFENYLNYLYTQLKLYSERFNYLILSRELSTSIRKEGRSQHEKAQAIFMSIIQNRLNEYYDIDTEKSSNLAEFISNNLIAMITIQSYHYSTFKQVIIDLLKQYKERQK